MLQKSVKVQRQRTQLAGTCDKASCVFSKADKTVFVLTFKLVSDEIHAQKKSPLRSAHNNSR